MTRSFFQPLLLVCLLFTTALHAQEPALFKEGNQLYRQQNYRGAAAKYQQLIDSGYQVADLYLNAGNAYYKSNQTGMAVYSFEKALSLKPDDEAIEHNLKLANAKVYNNIESLPLLFFEKWWMKWQSMHAPAGWATGAIVLFWILSAGIIAYFFIAAFKGNKYLRWSLYVFSVLFIAYFSMAFMMQSKAYHSGVAIVMHDVKVKAAPDAGSKDLFETKEGIKVEVLDGTKEFSKIQLADGKTGWVAVGDIREL